MDKNFKPVVGFDDNLSNSQQNFSPTSYAVGKMRAGRTPKQLVSLNTGLTEWQTITDLNKLYKPDLFFMAAGATHCDNNGGTSEHSCYVYNLIQDPDESLNGGHTITDHRTMTMNFRQIQYSNAPIVGSVTTRVGTMDSAVASQIDNYKKIDTVQQIYNSTKSDPIGVTRYAYVKDIGMWIRYQVVNTSPHVTVSWEPAITWGSWKSIAGDNIFFKLEGNATAELNTHYVSFGTYTLTLPNVNNCPVGSKVTLDQWSANGKVQATWGDTLYEINTSPAIRTVGLSDMKIHNDDALLPPGSLFINNNGITWTSTYESVQYVVKKVTLRDGNERFAIVTSTSDVLLRICYSDILYPHAEGLWRNVNSGGTSKTANDIDIADVATGVPTQTTFTTNDVADNICGCTTYTFEVSYDPASSNAKRWVLTRSSDMEAYLARINTLLSSTVQDHSTRIGNIENSMTSLITDMSNTKRKYTHNEKVIVLFETGAGAIYGDNAKIAGEPLIVYNENNWVDPSTLTDTSYIVNYFLARLTPVYVVQRNTSSAVVKSIYLPTRSSTMIGKRIKIMLPPWASVNVVDDNTSGAKTYNFIGASTPFGDPIVMTELTFELVQYIDHTNITKYAWAYSTRQFNTSETY